MKKQMLIFIFLLLMLVQGSIQAQDNALDTDSDEIFTDTIIIDGRTYKIAPGFSVPADINIDSPVKLNFSEITHELQSIERLVEDTSTGESLEYHFGIVNAISKPGADLSYRVYVDGVGYLFNNDTRINEKAGFLDKYASVALVTANGAAVSCRVISSNTAIADENIFWGEVEKIRKITDKAEITVNGNTHVISDNTEAIGNVLTSGNWVFGYCRYYGGRYIEVGTPKGELINVMDIQLDTDDPLIGGTEQLVAFAEAVRGTEIRPGSEWNVLADAYKRALIDREWLKENYDGSVEIVSPGGWKSGDAPLLGDIVDILKRDQVNPDAFSMSQMLAQYVGNGVYASYFNRPTTFSIRDENLVIFGLKHVNAHSSSSQLRVYLWQILGLIWSEVLGRHMKDKETANNVMLDEVWALLKAPGGVGAIENMARRFRKRKAGLWMATQEVREFLDSPDAKKVLSIVGNTFLMDQRPTEAALLQNLYSLPAGTESVLTHLGTGRGLMVLPDKILRISVAVPKEWHSY